MTQSALGLDADADAVGWVVIDFEGTTPAGHRPEPIEVAALVLRAGADGELVEQDRYAALIRPPEHAPLTWFDTRQTGITTAMLEDQPDAAQILAQLDRRLAAPPYLLVAQHATTEVGIIADYAVHCPHLAATTAIDTLRLAKVVLPDLPSYSLDHVLARLGIARPAGRHRAMPDVEATAHVFTRLVWLGAATRHWTTLRQLRDAAGLTPPAAQPQQESLF